ncbi:MAG: AAA family ATPase, partial [Candidatus Marsarchaeota archaeon]|nr:AAA family ATPase [Candidatus Marsarchaeota archaeon]
TFSILLEFAAAGCFEILAILSVLVGDVPAVVLLDEPALNLHPSKQQTIKALLKKNSSSKQIILITHSPYLIDIDSPQTIVRLELSDGETKIHKLRGLEAGALETLKKELGRNNKLVSMLFARRVIFVEGDDEETAIPIWLKKCNNLDLNGLDVPVISVGGKNNFITYKHIAEDWGIENILVFDKDTFKAPPDPLKGIVGSNSCLHYNEFDFTKLYDSEPYKSAFERCKSELGVSNGDYKKDPVFARYVADNTEPTADFKDNILAKLSDFIQA